MSSIESRARDLLIDLGLITSGTSIDVRSLTGGVSSDIALVRSGNRSFCVKFALSQLKVEAVWTAPVGRNAADYEWLDYVSRFAPDLVPALYGRSDALGGFAMAFLDPVDHPNWKTELLAGRVDLVFAGKVGAALASVHAHASSDSAARARFDNKADFVALRLDPYFAFTAAKHPDIAPMLFSLIAEQTEARISLVHGDVSPKNILMGPRGPVILDAECAVEGDPAFDIAFCLNHLIIKAFAAKADPRTLAGAASMLWSDYEKNVDWEPASQLEQRVTRLLPALMLARVDGKSPVEYLDPLQRDRLRDFARGYMLTPPRSVSEIVGAARMMESPCHDDRYRRCSCPPRLG